MITIHNAVNLYKFNLENFAYCLLPRYNKTIPMFRLLLSTFTMPFVCCLKDLFIIPSSM